MSKGINRRNALFTIGAVIVATSWVTSRQTAHRAAHLIVPEITNATAQHRLDDGVLVIDVSDEQQFKQQHLPGAILVPIIALRLAIPAVLAEAKARQIIVYCYDGITSGPEATQILQRNGFKHAVNLTAGLEGWASDRLPVIKA